MRKLALVVAAGAALFAAPASAQVVIDMSLITCKQMLEMEKSDPDTAALVTWWMGGYFSATKNLTTIDLRYAKRNIEKVSHYCKKMHNSTLMEAIEKNYR
jgi:acid stress chaperone HdeB